MAIDADKKGRSCSSCGGVLLWEASARSLRCQVCGALQSVDERGFIDEHDLEAALKQHKLRGRIGSGTRQVRCGECHAEVELPDELQATRCEFCGSTFLVKQTAQEDHYQPESLVPFAIDRAAAMRAFGTWLGRLWLRPSNLRHAASLHELSGIYIPYWAFGCKVTSHFSADAGYTYVVTERTKDGEHKRQRIRWEPCSGQRYDCHADHLICASQGLASVHGGSVQRFDTSGLLPYLPEYLLGFSAERYAVDLREAWQRAKRSIETLQEHRCRDDIPGDTQRGLRTTHKFQDVHFKHVLLPMWIASYRFSGRLHRFLVNGQTGEVAGTAPRSLVKVSLVILFALALLVALIYFLHTRQPEPTPLFLF